MEKVREKTYRYGKILIFGIGVIGVVFICMLFPPRVLRRARNEIIYRLPFAVPGLPPCPDCNIVLVNFDTMRASQLPCYGYERDTTENLCRYAKTNILFTRFYTQSSVTLDSHMSIFTGLYPNTHHVIEALKDSLNPNIPTLTQTLAQHGYRTLWGGATDDIMLPLDKGLGRGFDEVHHMDGANPDAYASLLPALLDDTPTFIFFHSYAPHSPYLPGVGPRRYVEAPPGSTIPVTHQEFRAQPRPFYEFVLSKFVERLTKSQTQQSKARNTQIIQDLQIALKHGDLDEARKVFWELPMYEQYDLNITWYWLGVDKTDPAAVSYITGLYDEQLYRLDQDIRSMLSFLERPEVKRKTIVIFFSDNGEELMERGRFDHGWNIFNIETHAPFIVAAPRMRSGVYHNLVQAVDMYPTLLDLVGIKPTGPLEGKSLRPILEGRGEQHAGDTYLVGQHRGDKIVSVRNNRWKMYKNNYPEARYVELFDLLTDPMERNNVLGEHLDIARRLDEALNRILKASPRYSSVSGEFPNWIDEEKRNSLIEEGYF